MEKECWNRCSKWYQARQNNIYVNRTSWQISKQNWISVSIYTVWILVVSSKRNKHLYKVMNGSKVWRQHWSYFLVKIQRNWAHVQKQVSRNMCCSSLVLQLLKDQWVDSRKKIHCIRYDLFLVPLKQIFVNILRHILKYH